MADLEHASPGDTDLHGDTSALNWAERFASRCSPPDVTGGLMFFGDHTIFERAGVEALMLTWFAGAIESGVMAGQDSPRRGSQTERWLRRQRDLHDRVSPEWQALDEALDDYRLHADTGTPLDQEVPEHGH